jgi:hypothetical protein
MPTRSARVAGSIETNSKPKLRGHVSDAKFKVFPQADHSIIEFPPEGEAAWPKFAAGYIGLTLDWLLRHVRGIG